jgi:MFS family permease
VRTARSHVPRHALPRARARPLGGRLWRDGDFLRLWAGQSISLLGSQVTLIALPLAGILVLHASPGQLGLLNAAEYLPVLFITPLGGVWADRYLRRPILLGTNVGLALVTGIVPLLGWLGGLSMGVLYLVAFMAGTLTAQFNVAYIAYLPALVDKADLVEGNSKLQSSQSVAQVAGQGASGILVQFLTAPGAVLVDSASYAVAAVAVLAIRRREQRPSQAARRHILREAAEGLRVTWGSRLLRSLIIESAWFNMFADVMQVVVPIYALRTLHLAPATLGVIIACGSAGAFAGAVLAGRLARRVGVGPAMAVGMLAACAAYQLIPVAAGRREVVIAALIGCYLLYGTGMALFNVHSLSIRQALVPNHMMGRVAASYRLVSWATIPVGGALGGLAAGIVGSRVTLLAAGGALLGGAVVFSLTRSARVRSLDDIPSDLELVATAG